MEETTTQTVEGVSEQEKPESQESQATSQEAVESQDQSVDKVESTKTNESSISERRRPSEYYEARERYKKRLNNLEQTIADLQNQIGTLKQPKPDSNKPEIPFDADKFWTNPQEVLQQILEKERKSIQEQLRKEILEKELPNVLSQASEKQEKMSKQQEALEIVFPRSGPDDKRSLAERVNAEPEKIKQLDKIWLEHGLQYVWENDPNTAISTLMKLKSEPVKKNPNVIPKSQAGSTATGSPISGGKKMASFKEIKSELDVLDKQVDENPDLRYDDRWNERRDKLVNAMSALAQELGKGK